MDYQMDLKLIRNLVRLMERGELSELEIDDTKAGMRLHLKRGTSSDSMGPMMMVPPAGSMQPMHDMGGGASHAPSKHEEEDGGRPVGVIEITSPMVGTFYRASGPDEEPFASVGTRVDPETVVSIIEAMKVMNEIKAEVTGEIVEILVENGEPVEFGQPLFLVKRA
jgi:acetyl-CoA carboxylase biotin carboxyl carrier protein